MITAVSRKRTHKKVIYVYLRVCKNASAHITLKKLHVKVLFTRSQICCTALIRSALESPDPGAPIGGSDVQIRPLGSNLVTFEVTEMPQNLKLIDNSKNISPENYIL